MNYVGRSFDSDHESVPFHGNTLVKALPCPLCGCGVNFEHCIADGGKLKWFVTCKDMGCLLGRRLGGYIDLPDLVGDWNKRAV